MSVCQSKVGRVITCDKHGPQYIVLQLLLIQSFHFAESLKNRSRPLHGRVQKYLTSVKRRLRRHRASFVLQIRHAYRKARHLYDVVVADWQLKRTIWILLILNEISDMVSGVWVAKAWLERVTKAWLERVTKAWLEGVTKAWFDAVNQEWLVW